MSGITRNVLMTVVAVLALGAAAFAQSANSTQTPPANSTQTQPANSAPAQPANNAPAQPANTVQVQTANGVSYLTDGAGTTLYYFTLDVDGRSRCVGGCLSKWPPFNAASITVPSTLSAGDFGTIQRPDGSSQTTYRGWPLYYWYKDQKPGDATGDGAGGVWFIVKVPAYTVMIGTSRKARGNYLTDGQGNTLYYFRKDTPGQSNCSGGCLKAWPAFNAATVQVPSALNPSDFATITRADGSSQTTYKGYPLYYFVGDKKRGELAGQGLHRVWYVIDPRRFPPAQ